MTPKVEKYLVVIAGPTAVGKTELSVRLAGRFASEIISADSRQMFRQMHIGTAKPSPEDLARVRHHFIDMLSLNEPYSAGRYAHDCHALLETLFRSHDVLFMTGGSGLYIRAVIEGFDRMPAVPEEVRSKWEKIHAEQGVEALQRALLKADPAFAATVDLKNHRRLIRALSLIEVSGRPVSELRRNARAALPFRVIRVFCNLPRDILYARIRMRVDEMIRAGLVEEVRSLLPYRDTLAMQTVGYRELVAYFDGNSDLDETIEKIKQHSCNYAKRQITWFRHQGDWKEFNPPDEEAIFAYLQNMIKKHRS